MIEALILLPLAILFGIAAIVWPILKALITQDQDRHP